MTHLIARLRAMTETAAADYSVDGLSYWSDDQLQDVLDARVERIDLRLVYPTPERISGLIEWRDYPVGERDLEEPDSGLPYWSLTDSAGAEVAPGLYALDALAGVVRFAADQHGALYFVRARAYPLARAAADVWRMKMAHAASLYDFRAEDQQFSRAQWFDHCRQMAEMYAGQAGPSFVPIRREDL
jgi:hypothetical protein